MSATIGVTFPVLARTIPVMTTKGFVVLLCAVAIGCGNADSGNAAPPANTAASASISCMYTGVISVEGTPHTFTACIEPPGLPAAQEPSFSSCGPLSVDAGISMTATGVFVSQGCSRANVAGGCQMTSGGILITQWYYADALLTADLVKLQCVANGGIVVTP
jgi:hypothetical protein